MCRDKMAIYYLISGNRLFCINSIHFLKKCGTEYKGKSDSFRDLKINKDCEKICMKLNVCIRGFCYRNLIKITKYENLTSQEDLRVRVKVFDTDYSTEIDKFISKFVLDLGLSSAQSGVEHNDSLSRGTGQLDFAYKVRNAVAS